MAFKKARYYIKLDGGGYRDVDGYVNTRAWIGIRKNAEADGSGFPDRMSLLLRPSAQPIERLKE